MLFFAPVFYISKILISLILTNFISPRNCNQETLAKLILAFQGEKEKENYERTNTHLNLHNNREIFHSFAYNRFIFSIQIFIWQNCNNFNGNFET